MRWAHTRPWLPPSHAVPRLLPTDPPYHPPFPSTPRCPPTLQRTLSLPSATAHSLALAHASSFRLAAGGLDESNALLGGALLGVFSTVVALCLLCIYRRYRRRMAARGQSKGLYMPYGYVDGPIDPDRVADMQEDGL